MHPRTFGVAAGLVLAADAFLIPPGLAGLTLDDKTTDAFRELSIPSDIKETLESLHLGVSRPFASEDSVRFVGLVCDGCSFTPAEALKTEGTMDVHNAVMLTFGLSDDAMALELNGDVLYPPELQTGTIMATQMLYPEDGNLKSITRQLSYMLGARFYWPKDGSDNHVVDITFQITSLGEEDVSVDSINIRLLENEAGKLTFLDVTTQPVEVATIGIIDVTLDEAEPVEENIEDVCDSGSSISSMMCRLGQAIKQKVKELHLLQPSSSRRPCPGKMSNFTGDLKELHIPHHFNDFDDLHHPPSYHSTHGYHHSSYHGFIHTVAMGIRSFALGFVLPVLVGVVAGLTASILGMIVGTAIGWLWIKIVRRGRCGRASSEAQDPRAAAFDADDADVTEKDNLLDHAPAYEDRVEAPPVYVEKE